MRKFFLVVVLLTAVGALAAHGNPAEEVTLQPQPTEITLYTQNIAEVTAVVSHFGEGDITLWLPGTILEDTVVVEDGGTPLPHTLRPLLEETKNGPDKTKEYLAKIGGLPAGEHSFLVRYRTRGLGWNPNYSLTVGKPGEGVLRSAVSITNKALDLKGVTLKLVSGRVQTTGYEYEYEGYEYSVILYRAMSQRSPHIPSPSLPGNIHEIQVLHDMTIPKDATRQLPIQETKLGVEELLVWDATVMEYTDPTTRERATAVYTLHNETGRPLAEGKVKVHEEDTFVGEGFMGWTLQGDKGTLVLPGVKDLTVKREEKTEELPQTWERRQTTSLKVTNHGNLPARVKIVDQGSPNRYYRYRDDQPIYTFSEDPEVTTEGAYSWTFTVPAQQEHIISYDQVRALDPSKFLVLRFTCDDSANERRYLYEERGSIHRAKYKDRYMHYDAYAIYRLDLPDNLSQADMVVKVGGNFLISVALEEDGKPGDFEALIHADLYAGRQITDYKNRTQYFFDLSPYLKHTKSNVLYVKFEDATKHNRWGPWLDDVEIYRVPAGFPSRGRDYMKEALVSRPRPGMGEMLFSDDFDREDLKGWQPERPGAKGLWYVSDGGLSPKTIISNDGSLLTERDFPRDLVITSGWKALDPADYVVCVVFSHGDDPENYYYLDLWVKPDAVFAALWFWEGEGKTLTTTSLHIDHKAAHELTLIVDETRIRIWLDGLLLIDWHDKEGRLKKGPIGFRGHNVKMDWVKVHALASE
ncbi:MAG: DUF1080 domain-containing protein [Armatimonadetes bacterium]|nr:DUF1080 domain-containing protein [Armatimonadota bacterium]NIM24405.1 DUF1080 domain-containing protein [Armatimonadota bacterium]NIM68276.1 DUF1080 domain-containing protein [Armatimonadota bacterium]NIM76680.1 DUF1080 domain-containing protein [Armatimonadota bacterium]NIN06479.1 DUF1080 domain-containing protein [Armatimonadota bacterium]